MSTDFDDDELKELRDELEQIIADGGEVVARQQHAREVRFCEWDGQSEDGRKHEEALGEPALPFDGAPDSRIPLVDLAVNDKVKLVKTAFFRSQVQASPVESSDTANAQAATTLLRYLRQRVMRKELRAEVELSAQYMFGDDPGLAVVEVKWWQDSMLQKRLLTFDELAGLYVTGEQNPDAIAPDDARLGETEMLADFADLVMNPIREREFEQWLGDAFPSVSSRALRRAVREMRKKGEAELPVPVIRENRPSVATLRYMEDVFFPLGTADIQRARGIHRVEYVTETELRERVVTMGWDADEVEDVIANGRGQTFASQNTYARRVGGVSLSGPGMAVNERDNLFEIWWSYARRADDDLGVPGVWCTVWNCTQCETVLKHELVDYDHGLYPFALGTRERVGRQVTDSRGLGRPIETHQNEVKIQRDARGVHISLTAAPPSKVKAARGMFDLILGPNAQNPVQRMDDWELVQMPSFTGESVEMERTTKAEVDEYVGRLVPGVDPNRAALIQQDDVDNFLALWADVFEQVLALCQQYYTPAELARVTGADMAPAPVQPEEIRGGWDVLIEIDARDLNMEFAMKKLEAAGKLLTFDPSGQFDRGPWLEVVANGIDPVLARKSLRPANNVTQQEVDAAKNALTQMAAGIEPDMPTQGINAQLRMQTIMQHVQASPRLKLQYQQDPLFRQLLENYGKYLQQQVAQDQNKVIGRIGTAPMQAGPQSAALGG